MPGRFQFSDRLLVIGARYITVIGARHISKRGSEEVIGARYISNGTRSKRCVSWCQALSGARHFLDVTALNTFRWAKEKRFAGIRRIALQIRGGLNDRGNAGAHREGAFRCGDGHGRKNASGHGPASYLCGGCLRGDRAYDREIYES